MDRMGTWGWRRVVAAAAALWLAGGATWGTRTVAAQAPTSNLVLEKVALADGVWLFKAPGDLDKWTSTNSVVVIGDDGVLVFDSNTLPSTTRMVLAEIRKLTDKPVRVLVNSHWHMDHWSGNEVYADAFPGLQILSTYVTRNFMARMPTPFFVDEVGLERSRARLDTALATGRFSDGRPVTQERVDAIRASWPELEAFEREVAETRRVLPNMTFADSLSLRMGAREFVFHSVTGDAAGSTVMWMPAERILVTGDVLVRRENDRGAQPWTMNSYAVSEWLEGFRKLESFHAGTIVPGQGSALHDGTYLRDTREMYESLITQAHRAMEQGAVKLVDVRMRVDVEDYKRRFGVDDEYLTARFEEVVNGLLTLIIQEAHDGIKPPE